MNRHVHLKICIQLLTTFGLWKFQPQQRALNRLQLTLKTVALIVSATIIISQFIQMYLIFENDKNSFAELASVNLLYNVAVVKIYIISKPSIQKIISKIQLTEVNILNCSDEEVKRIYMQYVKATYFENHVWIAMAYGCVLLYGCTPLLVELSENFDSSLETKNNVTIHKTRLLPLVSWCPFDTDKYHRAAYTFHIVVLIVVPGCVIACNNLMTASIIFTVGQLKILQTDIKNVPHAGEDDSVRRALLQCIFYHRAIIQFVDELNATMRTFLLFDFASCALQISVLVFRLAMTDVSFIMLNTLVYLSATLTQLFLFYWYANEIILESVEVANAAYESLWYLYGKDNKRTLILVMLRAQRPLAIEVGPLYIMSTQTMVSIMRAGYSYGAIMRRTYKK